MRNSARDIASTRKEWKYDKLIIEDFACECGAMQTTTVVRDEKNSLTKSEAVELAHRLRERVMEELDDEESFDDDVFYGRIRDLKSDEEMSNRDDEIYERAVEAAVN